MKKHISLLLSMLLIIFITACDDKPADDNVINEQNPVMTFVDYFDSEDMPWGEMVEKDVPEFAQTKFKWSDSQFIAIKDGVETVLITGMPIWNVFVTDLNDDGMPEFCATTSFGSGIADNRVIAVDYANSKTYEISDRTNYDYYLSIQDEKLIVTRTPYPYRDHKSSDNLSGRLIIKNKQLVIEYTNGETQA